jgi:sorting nexin-8
VEEWTGRELPLDLESQIAPQLDDQLDRVRQNLTPAINIYVRQCHILDRLRHRIRINSVDYARYANFLTQLSEDTDLCPTPSCSDCPSIDNGLRNVASGLDLVSGVLLDESRAYDEGILEDLKRQRDVLVAMKELFDRRDRLAGDNVPSLEKRITNTELKIQVIKQKPDVTTKVDQIAKLEEQIVKVPFPLFFLLKCLGS